MSPLPSPSTTPVTTHSAAHATGQPIPSLLDIKQFRRAMEKAADQHTRSYTDAISMSIRWEGDDTNANMDTESFQNILKVFNFPKASELIIPQSDPTPGFLVRPRFDDMLIKAKSMIGRTLVLVHYTGHGTDINGDLHLVSLKGRTMSVNKFLFEEVSEQQSLLGRYDQVDVVFFFDCCYGHLATRTITALGRVVEVLAAVDASDPAAFAAGGRAAFTSKLANEIAARKGRGDKDVEFAELIASLRKKKAIKKPTNSLRVGVNSIRLKFPGPSVQKASTSAQDLCLQAVFTFRIAKAVTTDELADFVRWIRLLPTNIGLQLEDVYETGSVCLILRSRYSFFSHLRGLPGSQFVCETQYPSQLANVLAAANHTTASPQRPPFNQENVPPQVPGSYSQDARRRTDKNIGADHDIV